MLAATYAGGNAIRKVEQREGSGPGIVGVPTKFTASWQFSNHVTEISEILRSYSLRGDNCHLQSVMGQLRESLRCQRSDWTHRVQAEKRRRVLLGA